MFRKTAHPETGFTLLELLIVISIIVVITATVVPSFAGYIRNQGVRQAAEQVKSDMRSIQNKALTGALSDQTVNSNPVEYWGIRFSPEGGGSSRYEYFISDTATSCPIDALNAEQLQGYADIPQEVVVKTSAYRCLYFSMANGSITPINFSTNDVTVGYAGSSSDGDCRHVLFTTNGLIHTGTATTCN